ncbi:hypothetical protein [Streptomyces sp. SP18CM02]|uniref:hypothetical protein n=1 Tax=Streptomyces sp. SP18CM02 TaxID=2758571 RepID=UPI00168B2F9D|nr:hypothetical protein [Streptomyces sp. SP18CM02]MBD3554397.1 hypothetical protein [Streptomyces sp. SP18CM02]
MVIIGYGGGPAVVGEELVGRAGFWGCHLLGLCEDGACDERAEPAWFGGDGADADALAEVLFDPERWPVFRVPVEGAAPAGGVAVVYRNLDGDGGVEYRRTGAVAGGATGAVTGGATGGGTGDVRLSWGELVAVADGPGGGGDGVSDRDERFLLLLPCLRGTWEEAVARERVVAALVAVGAPEDTVERAAGHLLGHLERRAVHEPGWKSPLSGR